MHQHKKNALSYNASSKVCNKIRKIIREGGDVIARKVYETSDEFRALDHEIMLIDRIGLANLCNITLGGEGTTMHKRQKLSQLVAHKTIRLSPDDLKLLGHCPCHFGPTREPIRAGTTTLTMANYPILSYEELPESVKDIVSGVGTKPYMSPSVPLAEVIASLKYGIPNQHYNWRHVVHVNGDRKDFRRDNILFMKGLKDLGSFKSYATKHRNYIKTLQDDIHKLGKTLGCI
jgi:hypothetical protein